MKCKIELKSEEIITLTLEMDSTINDIVKSNQTKYLPTCDQIAKFQHAGCLKKFCIRDNLVLTLCFITQFFCKFDSPPFVNNPVSRQPRLPLAMTSARQENLLQ